MKYADICVGAKINDVSFRDDTLVFEFSKIKWNRNGVEFPWHVYAITKVPWICPVLAFVRYLLCHPFIHCGDVPLFQGSAKYSQYLTRLTKILKEMEAEELVGFEPSNIGSHSACKGVATWVVGGCTVSLPIVAMFLRAGWSLGGVKDRYLFYVNASDQYVGHCGSALITETKEYAISRAYFEHTLGIRKGKDCKEEEHSDVVQRERLQGN
ncbi:hypothetical protein ACHAW6_005119 [Cyclotella cf. meneghiniana]